MRTTFKVGDNVWNFNSKKWGTITRVLDPSLSSYPVEVGFSGDCGVRSFTMDGCEYKGDCRVLFFEEVKIPKECLLTQE